MRTAAAKLPEAARAQDLLAQALDRMQAQRWDEAMRLLEAAIPMAPSELHDPAVEILTSIYVSRNEHARLGELMLRAEPSTPQMIKGALLLARNRAIGVDGELPAHCNEKSLAPILRAHIVSGAYQANELPVIVALLAQVGWAELAGEIAMLCIAAHIAIEDGVLERVFAVLLTADRRADALQLLEAVRAMPQRTERPVQRWAHLLGCGHAEAEDRDAAPRDKVVRFLQVTQSADIRIAAKEPVTC
jgi:hypothetical protein